MDGQALCHHGKPGLASTGLIRRRHLNKTPCRWWQRNRRCCMVPLSVELRGQHRRRRPFSSAGSFSLVIIACYRTLMSWAAVPFVPTWYGNILGGLCSMWLLCESEWLNWARLPGAKFQCCHHKLCHSVSQEHFCASIFSFVWCRSPKYLLRG